MLSQDLTIYTNRNKYHYRYNVNHPVIGALYQKYKENLRKIGKLQGNILSDAERFEFERLIDILLINERAGAGHGKSETFDENTGNQEKTV